MNIKATSGLTNTTKAVVEIRPEKKFSSLRDFDPLRLQYRC